MSQHVLITGGSRGIGAACARRFATSAYRLTLLARPSNALSSICAQTGATPLPCDLANVKAISDTVAQLEPVDILINNAGIVHRHPVVGHSLDAWEAVMAINLRAPFLLARAVIPGMCAAGGGRIINVSSISGRLGTPDLSAYCASKWGLLGFTKALQAEVKADGIVVTAICPGSVDTRMLKGSGYPPDMTPDDVAEAIYFLATAPPAIAGSILDLFG